MIVHCSDFRQTLIYVLVHIAVYILVSELYTGNCSFYVSEYGNQLCHAMPCHVAHSFGCVVAAASGFAMNP